MLVQVARASFGLSTYLACTLLWACGGAPARTPQADAKSDGPKTAMAESPAKRGTLKRAVVARTIEVGLGEFLSHVELSDKPAEQAGKFRGWRIVKLTPAAAWDGFDLHPGDVVVRVNGLPLEHPEEAMAALEATKDRTKIDVLLDRDGKEVEIHVPIEE